jgi:glycosyltransferase involved in cell wall biosynthesis
LEEILKNRIVVVTEYFYPAERNDAILITKIVKALSISNDIEVICTSTLEEKKELDFLDGKIHRLKNLNITSKNIILRVFKLLYLTFQLIFKSIFFLKKNDKVFIVTNPVFLLPFIVFFKKIKKFEVTLLVYDVFPENLIATNLLKKQNLFYKLLKKIYDWSYNNVDKMIVIGRDMQEFIQKKTNNKKDIFLIENWCDYKKIIPMKKEDNSIIKRFNLENRIVFSFVGNFGLVQGIENLLNAASLVKNEEFVLLFIGDGGEKRKIENFIENNHRDNVLYAGKYPGSEENMFLNACDVAIVSLNDSMYGLGVPSKSYYNMAAEKPLLYVGHKNTEIAKVINDNSIGWICESSNSQQLADLIDKICEEKINFSLLGKKSRDILIKYYSEEIILNKYKKIY